MDINVNIPFFLIQRLADSISDSGSILFISSAMSLKPHATSVPYGVSKAAVNMLAQTLGKDFAGRGIRVNAICPGFIDTDWQESKSDEQRARITNKIALGRFGKPSEIADVCYSLIENSYINGAVVPVDGGYDMM
jgi:NAD(P)-dependent dehydrogenase (short-subunit alcohol dehydrogenase family)